MYEPQWTLWQSIRLRVLYISPLLLPSISIQHDTSFSFCFLNWSIDFHWSNNPLKLAKLSPPKFSHLCLSLHLLTFTFFTIQALSIKWIIMNFFSWSTEAIDLFWGYCRSRLPFGHLHEFDQLLQLVIERKPWCIEKIGSFWPWNSTCRSFLWLTESYFCRGIKMVSENFLKFLPCSFHLISS